ncbi:histone-fold-containing protein [Trematosphaeria pertusa]|uniref:Histone-fold-containing protein n=1 Tax=Trematosphaeria pertusa TaxID=390896 RepID=A0A6A6IGL2_9PLEO|nr:histone-fold-containing protein [Trematosphaeria pertusa]KAF2249551.1 histone-fold-containing protein [Trematosphaeria pertusa]
MASPPHVPQLNIPSRKRSSISSISSAAKKRKPSGLRHTFAPESEVAVGSPLRYSRSPSADSVATGSVAGGRKRKRRDGDAVSVTGSSARGGKARSAVDGGAGGEGGEGEEGEELDDEDLEEEMDAVLEGGKATDATKKQEKEHERILMQAMDADQSERYATYRRIRLKRETVRKLVNQTLSQSVPQPVIIAVTSYSKAFIGELIDMALTVRDEWTAARTHIPNPDLPPAVLIAGLHEPFGHRKDSKPSSMQIQQAGYYLNQVDKDAGFWKEIAKDATLQERLKECDKGPLTPAHLREALRRYKRDREGGGAGFAGLSLEGPERTLARTGGKRLFR